MASIAAVLIVKNEAPVLRSCLEKLSWADEIIILDSGSRDETLELAREFTQQVYQELDWQGYGIQRQRAQLKTNADWIFMVDADEHVSDQLRSDIQKIVKENNPNIVCEIPILPWCFGRFIRHSGWYPAYKVRLYANSVAKYGPERVHEKLYYSQDVEIRQLKGDLYHYTYRDLEHYLVKSAGYAREWAEQRRQSGKTASLSVGILHGLGCFIKMYLLKAGFLDGKQGFLLALLSAHSTFAKYADLWIRTKTTLVKPLK